MREKVGRDYPTYVLMKSMKENKKKNQTEERF